MAIHIIDVERRNASWDTAEIWAITTTVVTTGVIAMEVAITVQHLF